MFFLNSILFMRSKFLVLVMEWIFLPSTISQFELHWEDPCLRLLQGIGDHDRELGEGTSTGTSAHYVRALFLTSIKIVGSLLNLSELHGSMAPSEDV